MTTTEETKMEIESETEEMICDKCWEEITEGELENYDGMCTLCYARQYHSHSLCNKCHVNFKYDDGYCEPCWDQLMQPDEEDEELEQEYTEDGDPISVTAVEEL